MIPKFKYFSKEPEPIPLSQTVGEPITLVVDYAYGARDEEGTKTEIVLSKGTVVYPLFRHSSSSRIYVADQRGNIFTVNSSSKSIQSAEKELPFINELPRMDAFENPLPFTHEDLDAFAVGRTMNEFFHRYRYPQSTYSTGGKTFAHLPDLYSQRKEEGGGRWSDLILIAENTDPADAANSIITGYRYTTPIGRKNFLDYVPYGSSLLDNSSSLRKFIRGIEQQTLDDESAFSMSLTDWGEKAIRFVLPNSWHDGFIDKTLNFLFLLFSLFFMSFAGVPLLIIPYLIFVAVTIRISSFSNKQINIIGAAIGVVFLLPGIFLFAITEIPFVGYLAIIVTFTLGYIAYKGISDTLSWGRCEECISWGTYEFTEYIWEGSPIAKTTTRKTWTETTHKDGSKSTSDHQTHSSTAYYRDVTKEYVCRECGETREKDEREYLSEQRAMELADE